MRNRNRIYVFLHVYAMLRDAIQLEAENIIKRKTKTDSFLRNFSKIRISQ